MIVRLYITGGRLGRNRGIIVENWFINRRLFCSTNTAVFGMFIYRATTLTANIIIISIPIVLIYL